MDLDLKEITVTLLDILLTEPNSDTVKMSRKLCEEIYRLMLSETKWYGPDITAKRLEEVRYQ